MHVPLVSPDKDNVTCVWVCLHVSAIIFHLTIIVLQEPGEVDKNMDDTGP